MTSSSAATFTVKGLSLKGAPASDVGINCSFKKVINGATFSLALTDASLREPAAGKGVVVSAARTFEGEALQGPWSRWPAAARPGPWPAPASNRPLGRRPAPAPPLRRPPLPR